MDYAGVDADTGVHLDILTERLAQARYGEVSRASLGLIRADMAAALRDSAARARAAEETAARDGAAGVRLRAGFEALCARVDAARAGRV